MKNNNIIKHSFIKEENINPSNFTLSLLGEAQKLNVLAFQEIENIQLQIMNTLGERIMKFTRGESCSVKSETAETILLSIFYCLDLYLVSLPDADACINELQNTNIKEIFEKGLALVKTYTSECRVLLIEVQKNKIAVELHAYNATIDEGFSDSFDTYDAEFSAHDTPASIDYPLLFDDTNILGISYVKQYLAKLILENEFCNLFDISEINSMLINYGRIYRFDYREMLINVFQLVLSNSIFSVLLGKSAKVLSISEDECLYLRKRFLSLKNEEYSLLIEKAIEVVISQLCITSVSMQKYIRQFKDVLAPILIASINNDTLDKLVITLQDEIKQTIVFNQGARIDDDSFKEIVNELLLCDSTEAKIRIIKSEFSCIDDFIDILASDCLFKNEYHALFCTLSDEELAMLYFRVSENQPHCDIKDFNLDRLHLTESEIIWQSSLISYLKSLSENRLNIISKLSSSFID